jgi:predicted AAA+ superfamily ATPase
MTDNQILQAYSLWAMTKDPTDVWLCLIFKRTDSCTSREWKVFIGTEKEAFSQAKEVALTQGKHFKAIVRVDKFAKWKDELKPLSTKHRRSKKGHVLSLWETFPNLEENEND